MAFPLLTWILLTISVNRIMNFLFQSALLNSRRPYGGWQAASLILRGGIFFGVTHLFWLKYRNPEATGLLIILSATLQLVVEVACFQRMQRLVK